MLESNSHLSVSLSLSLYSYSEKLDTIKNSQRPFVSCCSWLDDSRAIGFGCVDLDRHVNSVGSNLDQKIINPNTILIGFSHVGLEILLLNKAGSKPINTMLYGSNFTFYSKCNFPINLYFHVSFMSIFYYWPLAPIFKLYSFCQSMLITNF